MMDDDHFPRLANRTIAVFRRVLRTCLRFERRSRVRGQLLSGRSYVQTRIKVNNAGRPLYYRHASGVSCEPALPSDTRRLPSPFMALYRTSASALESKFAAGFTVPLLACNKSETGGLLIYEGSSICGLLSSASQLSEQTNVVYEQEHPYKNHHYAG